MLIDQETQEGSLLGREASVRLRALVQHTIGQLSFDLLGPDHVLLSKLDRILWIILELDAVFVLVEIS
jgi:hypothetical protein